MGKILVTGGMGYIGSHTCITLIAAGYEVCILDNLCNSYLEVLTRLERICGIKLQFVKGDILDNSLLERLFSENTFEAVIHFAGLKAVGESVKRPLDYYDNNVRGTLELLKVMRNNHVNTLVFSSSATVYGNPVSVPIKENFPRNAASPYGQSKIMVEDILSDLYKSEPHWRIACLRYFNPVGAHESGLIGEDPPCIPNNLMPLIAQVAIGRREKLSVFGNDYPTHDGTGVRDYIHVVDLAEGHVAALKHLQDKIDFLTINLGTGRAYSVLELISAFESAANVSIPFEMMARRAGDIAEYWADPTAAQQIIAWQAKKNLHDMCCDTWFWQQQNPHGYIMR